MFLRVRNLESSFQLIRTMCVVVVAGVFILCGYIFFITTRAIDRAQTRIYVLSGGKALEAMAGDRKDNIAVEARDHIRTFHSFFFTLDPDDRLVNDNLTRALYLADGSARRIYENLRESGYYSGIISGNISQRIGVDSVQLNLDSYPYYFRLFGKEIITRPTSVVTRELVTEGYLRDVSRSDNIPHGFLIERWSILGNSDLKIEQRLVK